MPNVIISPNMSLPVPVVGVDLGPDWANNLNSCLSTIDGHNHTPGMGVQIPPAGLNINADLTFQSNNATNLRTIRFAPQLSAIPASSPDLGCLYEAGVDLYYNDGAGNQIRITQSGSVAGASGTITGLPSGTASASYSSSSGTFIFQQSTNTAANMDIGTLILRYPGSYPTPAGNAISLEVPSSISSGYSLTLPLIPGATSFLTIDTSGNITGSIPTNAGLTGGNIAAATITGGNIASATITGSNIAADTIALTNLVPYGATNPAPVGSVAISTIETTAQGTSSGSYVQLGPTVTLTTNGGPVMVIVQGNDQDGTNAGYVELPNASSTGYFAFDNLTASYVFGAVLFSNNGSAGLFMPGNFSAIDLSVVGTPGTYTYQMLWKTSNFIEFNYIRLVAYEF